MLREEFIRALRSRTLIIAILVGIASFAQGFVDYISGPPLTPEYLSRLPPFYDNCYDAFIWAERGLIGLIVPFIAVLPFSDTLALDRTSGFLRSLLFRVSFIKYLLSKYVISFVSGGFAVAIPMLLFFGFTNLVLPRGLNPDIFQQRVLSEPNALGPFGVLYQTHPDAYIFSLVGLGFLFGGVYAIFGLSISAYIDNRYVVLATPFVVYIVSHYILAVIRMPAWSPLSAFVPNWVLNINWINIFCSLTVIFLVSTIAYFAGAYKNQIRA